MLENLRQVLLIGDSHVMKLLLFVFTSRTSFLVPIELEDSTLSSCFQESAF